jgi:hypothetical protein
MNFVHWVCPTCGWIISDVELQASRYDYGCSRCKTAYAHFLPVIPKDEDASDDGWLVD